MADLKKKLGALGTLGKRLLATDDEASLNAIRAAGRAAHEQEAAIRAAKNAQVKEQMARLPARNKKANEALGLYHPVGGGLKLSKPTSGMHATTVADPKFNPPDIGIITPEQLVKEEAALFPLVGDRAAGGRYLTHVDENELEIPVRLTGGPRYMDANYNPITPDDSAAWESGAGRVTALGKQAERAGQGGRPVYGIYTAGSGTNTDFNIMGANALYQQIAQGKITKKAEREFDRAMKEGTKEFPPIPNWPGIRSPEAYELLLDKSNGIARTKLFGVMGKENFQSMGFPDVPATRKSIIEPELLDVPTNQAGFRLARMDTTGRIIENPNIPSDYPKAMAGKVAGRLDVPADYKDIFQSHFDARRLLSQPESGDYYSFSRAHPIQYADDAWLNRLMEQRLATERKIKEGEYKEGGTVDISEADKRLEKAIENRMAKGGEVDLEAADARLSAAIEARMGMAGGGKVVKGAAKAFKKLFADDVLPAAERDANLDKFLSTSQEKRRLYHATPADFKEFQGKGFDPTISGNATWLTPNKEKQPAAHNTSSRTDVYREGVNVMPVYVKAERPLMLDDRAMEDWAKAAYANDSPEFPFLLAPEWLRKIKEDGYDSIFHPRSGEVIMLEPNKIKSAIGNRGTYDISDPDITKAQGGLAMADGGKLVKGAGKVMKKLFADDEPYSEISGMVSKMGEEGRLPIIPVPNRWFMQPDKFPNQQKLIERVLQQSGKSREDFMSGAFIDPRTGEILDSRIMDDLGVVIDPKTNRPMMSAKGESGLEQMNPKTGSYTKSNLVRKGLFKPEGGDPLLNDLNFLATIEKGDVGHKYGLATEYASPTELFNTGTGANPTLRPRSRGDLFGVGDVIGRVRVGRSEPHDVYEKLFVAPKGSDVQGKKLSKANGGLAMAKGGKLAAIGKLGKRLMADPDAVTPTTRGGTRKFGNDANGLNIIKETGGNWTPSGELVYQSQLDRELDKLKKGRFDTPINVLRYHMEQDALAGNTARKAQMEQALAQALKTEAANKWIDSNLRNYVTKQMASKDDPVRKLADEGIKAFPVNVDEFDEPQLRTYGSYNAKMKREKAGLPKEGVAKSPLAKHYETLADEAINPVDAKHFQRIQDLPRIQRPAYTMDMPWVNKLDPETPIYSLDKDADLNKLGFDHIMDVLREDLATGRIRPEQLNKISMEQAVRRTHEYDEALKAKMLNARIAEQANANVFKEYPEGYKWVQLDKPGQFNLESDIMGHSVRGYEPPQGHPDWADISGNSGYRDYGHGGYEAIKSGDAKIYSLRDPKGMSHVTVEVGPNDHLDYNDWFKKQPEEIQNKIAKRRLDDKNHDIYSGPEYLADRGKILPKITQIKGKQNAAPNEDYLEFVQDFVKSGDWSEVGDLSNTGLRDVKFMTNPDVYQKYLERGLKVPKYATEKELDELHNEYLRLAEPRNYKPPEGMAEGGGAFKKLQFMGGGGITTSGGSFSPEELGVEASDLGISDKRLNQIKRNAADLWGEGKEQLEKEYKQLGRKGGKKDFALRVGSQFLGGGSDLLNLGLEGIDLIQGAIPALSKPESVMDVAGTGDRVPKFRLASDKPWLGSQQFIDKFKEAKLLGENEFPLTELAAGFAAPAAAVGVLNKGKQAYKGAKTLVNTPKKRRGGLTAMAR